MSQVGRPQSFDPTSLTTPTVDARFKVGTRIEVDGVEYMYTQADDAIIQKIIDVIQKLGLKK